MYVCVCVCMCVCVCVCVGVGGWASRWVGNYNPNRAEAALFWKFLDHAQLDTNTSPLKLFWTSIQLVAEAATY